MPCLQKGHAPESSVARQSCSGNTCQWEECPPYYQPLPIIKNSAKKMKCKLNKRDNTFMWTKAGLWGCKTCDNLEPLENNPDFNVQCRSKKQGSIKYCEISCKNGEKIYPLNKPVAKNVQCKCSKSSKDCNWIKGRAKYDTGDHMDFSRWSCPETQQIPKHLQCMKNNFSGLPELSRSSVDRIVGGEEADKHSWPWVVRLQVVHVDGSEKLCAGTILDQKESVLERSPC